MWRLRIEQYFQIQDYALWDIIENGNSFNPVARTTTNADGTSTSTIPGPVTTEEKAQKKNDVKARSMLLMALPNEHQLTFNQYKDAKTLFAAIQTRFGGNDATKKTQKTLLKQMYENFNAPSTESLDSIFNRLQKIVSQLSILVWKNKPDLDPMSFDNLYKNFKIVQQEVSTANSTVSTDSTLDSTANLSDATVYAFLANQPNGSQLVHEDLEQIHEDNLEEIDLKWQLALLSMRARKYYQRTVKKITINGSDTAGYDKSKVECFNCHKMGHFARECIGPRNQESRARNKDSSRRTVNVEETTSKAMVGIDGAGFDWSYIADEEVPTNLDLMAFLDSEPEFKGYRFKANKGVCENSSNKIKKTTDAPIIEEWVSDCDEDDSEVIVLKFDNVQQKPKQANQPRKGTGQRKVRPVWNNAMRTDHQNFSTSRRNFAPTAVLTKSGKVPISTARQSSSRAAARVSAARPINTDAPKFFVNVAKTRPNAFQKSHSLSRRPFYQQTALKNRNLNDKVNTAKVNSVNTAKGNRVTSAVGEHGINAVKSLACWVWRPKIKTATVETVNDGEQQITVTVDGQTIAITEASVRRHLQLADADGISSLPNTEIFEQLTLMGYVSNDDKLTFQKGEHIPLFDSMLIHDQPGQGEGPTLTVESQHTPIASPTTSQPTTSQPMSSQEQPSQVPTTEPIITTSSPPLYETTIPYTTSSMPHDLPLSGGDTPGSDEGSKKLNELTELCTKLSDKVTSLEDDLKQTKKVYGKALTKLVKKDLVSEDPSKQGRKTEKEYEDVDVETEYEEVEYELDQTDTLQ
ncbi:ribonuclease H-like domain-containing protein [Tanacetum coccineum]